jgi:hypothetical protein
MPANRPRSQLQVHGTRARPASAERPSLDLLLQRALEMTEAGDPEAALRVIARAPNPADAGEIACNAIAFIFVSANRYREAVRWR